MKTVDYKGTLLAYDDAGNGEPALLCLPGWGATRTAFSSLPAAFGEGRRILALDWRGHGGSGPAPGDFGAAELVRDAMAVIAASGAQTIVPVATAHAGWIAIELRRALGPKHVPKLVLVDWIVGAAPPPFLDALAALQDPARWQAARDALFGKWLEGVDHEGVRRFVHDEMGRAAGEMWGRGGREIAAAYAQHGSPLEALAALDPPPPTLHVYAQPADDGFLRMQQSFAAQHSWFSVERLAAKSHFPTIEVPELIAAAVERFLAA